MRPLPRRPAPGRWLEACQAEPRERASLTRVRNPARHCRPPISHLRRAGERQQDLHVVVPAFVRALGNRAFRPFVPTLVVATIRAEHRRDWNAMRGIAANRGGGGVLVSMSSRKDHEGRVNVPGIYGETTNCFILLRHPCFAK